MGAVDRRQAGHGRRAGAGVQGGEQGAEFRHPVQDVEKLFHTVLLWRWVVGMCRDMEESEENPSVRRPLIRPLRGTFPPVGGRFSRGVL